MHDNIKPIEFNSESQGRDIRSGNHLAYKNKPDLSIKPIGPIYRKAGKLTQIRPLTLTPFVEIDMDLPVLNNSIQIRRKGLMNYHQMTAPCGLDCFNCPIYLMSDNGNDPRKYNVISLMAKTMLGILLPRFGNSRSETVRKLKMLYRGISVPKDQPICQGCRTEKGCCALHDLPSSAVSSYGHEELAAVQFNAGRILGPVGELIVSSDGRRGLLHVLGIVGVLQRHDEVVELEGRDEEVRHFGVVVSVLVAAGRGGDGLGHRPVLPGLP